MGRIALLLTMGLLLAGSPSSAAPYQPAGDMRWALYGNAVSRMSECVPSDGAYAYGKDPDIEALYNQQATELDCSKREALLHQIQSLIHERVMFGPLWEYIWPSGIGPRVEEPSWMLINPCPWSAPLEEVRLKPE